MRLPEGGAALLQLFISIVVILLVAAYAGRMTFLSTLTLRPGGSCGCSPYGLESQAAGVVDRSPLLPRSVQ